MTKNFDGLLRAGLARAVEEDAADAWDAVDAPPSEPPLERKEERHGKKTHQRRSPRYTGRIAVAAVLAVVLTLGTAIALVPGLAKYWSVTEQVVLECTGETVNYYCYKFHIDALSDNKAENEPVLQHWYPQWLPEIKEGRYYIIQADEFSPGNLEYEVRGTEKITYGKIWLRYEPMEEIYEVNVGFDENHTHYWKEVSVGKCPGFVLFVGRGDLTVPQNEEIPSFLIWFDFDAQIVFKLCGYGETGGYSVDELLRIAKSVQADRVYP